MPPGRITALALSVGFMRNLASLLVCTADGRVNPRDHTFVPAPELQLRRVAFGFETDSTGNAISVKGLLDALFTRIALPP